MTNTPHDYEPSWNCQINKAAKLFGSNGTEAAIGLFGFQYDGHGDSGTGTIVASNTQSPVATITGAASAKTH